MARIGRVFGDTGRAWLSRLPDIVAACRVRWRLAPGVASPHMSLNYLELTTTAGGRRVALKVGVPHAELFGEMEALRLFAGRRCVPLIDADQDLGALLLVEVRPGTRLADLSDDDQATRLAAQVMCDLAVPEPDRHGLPRYADWLDRALRLTRESWDPGQRMPRELLASAEAAFAALSDGAGSCVLHGDLHHENVLLDEHAGWLAIDPKGVIGPLVLEVGRWLHNRVPADWPAERRWEILRRRVARLGAELGCSPQTIAAAGLVDGVLSHCWCFEDESLPADWAGGLELVRGLQRLAGA